MSSPDHMARFAFKGWEIDLGRRELRRDGIAVPIGGRALDALEVLVRAGGRLVLRSDLMASVWRGTHVGKNSVHVLIFALRQALGPDRGLLTTTPGLGYRLLGEWGRSDPTESSHAQSRVTPGEPSLLERAVTAPGNLPRSVSELIGRVAAIATLDDLLSAYRVVTLVGSGGIGKTRLALEAARNFHPAWVCERWFVELAPLSDPELVASAVAGAIGIVSGNDKITAQSVARAVGNRRMLLVIDNCEHVIGAASELIEALVRSCPGTSVLATSQEVLRLDGEYVYRVPPLSVPEEPPQALVQIEQHSAVQLFLARVQAIRSDFTPDSEMLKACAAICRRLDGIPLAIELAAARAGILSLEAVSLGLQNRLALLVGGRRTALPRHRTLRATLDWSYDLLPPVERQVFRVLGLFPTSFTFEAATFVIEGFEAGGVASACISSLVNKSLLVRDQIGLRSRLRLLETTRSYASEKMEEHGETAQAARLHASFYHALIGPVGLGAQTPEYRARLMQHGMEIDNVRMALEWAFSPHGDTMLGIELASGYVPVWLYLSLMAECTDWINRTLNRMTPDLRLDARFSMQLHMTFGASMLHTLGAFGRVASVVSRAIELAEELGDLDTEARALWVLWSYHSLLGDQHAAWPVAERYLALARSSKDATYLSIADRFIGTTLHHAGDQLAARPYLERMLARYRPSDKKPQTTSVYINHRGVARTTLARVLWLQGFVEQGLREAAGAMQEAEASEQEHEIRHPLTWGVCTLTLLTGDLDEAERSVARLVALATVGRPSFWDATVSCLEAALLIRRGEFARGVAVLRPALETCVRTGWMTSHGLFLGILAEGYSCLDRIGDALETIKAAIEWSLRTGECWCLAELHRIHGSLLLRRDGRDAHSAKVCFVKGRDLAQRQGALWWELRVATCLAELVQPLDRADEDLRALAAIYSRFVEGFEKPDLRAARRLLQITPTSLT